MALIELEDLKEYLEGQMITAPDLVLMAYLELIDSITLCMTGQGYSEAKQKLILLTLLTLLVTVSVDGRLTGRRAPNGASQSFKIADTGPRWKALSKMLNMLDPFGCTAEFVPENPEGYPAGLWVSPGSQPGFCDQ